MRSLVVLFAVCAVAYGSGVSLLAHSPIVKYIGGSAVTHQSRVDVESSPAVVSHSITTPLVASPLISGYSGYSGHGLGLLSHGLGLGYSGLGHGYGLGLSGHGHLLKKRSVGLGLAHALPVSSHSSVSAYDVSINHGTPVAVGYTAPIAVAHAAPIEAHSAIATPVIAAHGLGLSGFGHGISAYGHGLSGHGFGHSLWKRSAGLLGYSAPLVTPLIAHASPIVKYVGGSAVTHQSRVDVHSSPAVVAQSVVTPIVSHSVVAAPIVSAHSVLASPLISAHGHGLGYASHGLEYASHGLDYASHGLGYSSHGLGYANHGLGLSGHLLKKRSLGLGSLAFAHSLPAVSYQSRFDAISSHVAPIAVAHAAPIAVAHAAPIAVAHAAPIALAAPAYSHQSRLDITSGAHFAPIAHSAIWTAPTHLSHSGLFHGGW